MTDRYFILKVPVDAVTKKEALDKCRQYLHNGEQNSIVTVNPEFIVEAQKNIPYRNVLADSDLALADGFGVVLATRWLHGLKLERVTGVDFMIELCALAEIENKSVFFLGGRGGAAQNTAEVLQKKFPKLNVAGWSENNVIPAQGVNAPVEHFTGSNGIWEKYPAAQEGIQIHQFVDGSRLVGRVDKKNLDLKINADILFVALGSPKQELWIAENLKKLPNVKIAMGVGGAFDLISGKIKRAPLWMRKLGLEWSWRLAKEPERWRRIVNAVCIFPYLCMNHRSNVK